MDALYRLSYVGVTSRNATESESDEGARRTYVRLIRSPVSRRAGAHAAVTGRPLVTRDPRRIATYLPGASLISPSGVSP